MNVMFQILDNKIFQIQRLNNLKIGVGKYSMMEKCLIPDSDQSKYV